MLGEVEEPRGADILRVELRCVRRMNREELMPVSKLDFSASDTRSPLYNKMHT